MFYASEDERNGDFIGSYHKNWNVTNVTIKNGEVFGQSVFSWVNGFDVFVIDPSKWGSKTGTSLQSETNPSIILSATYHRFIPLCIWIDGSFCYMHYTKEFRLCPSSTFLDAMIIISHVYIFLLPFDQSLEDIAHVDAKMSHYTL